MRLLLATILFWSTRTITHAAAVYPPYCSTPDQMHERNIPPLQAGGSYGASKLKHVTAVIRHGARTPWSGNLPCWKDFNNQGMPWDCHLKTSVSPELSAAWFNKQYDALVFPQHNLSNELQGTCELGQLLEAGVAQELTNGEHLRAAYFNDNTDSRLLLTDAKPWESLYYRADDEQRTLMSGRILLKGLFGNELTSPHLTVPLHTADYHRDILGENEDLCPRLTQMRELFYVTEEFRSFNESDDAKSLRDFQKRELGTSEDMELDCFMTTICTDRPLPDAINDYSGEDNTDSMFWRLAHFAVRQYTSFAVANDAAYSKLAIGPLWAEIMENIDRVVNNDKYPKLALFSGHDTTIIFLLASLPKVYDGSWPPYASKLLLEIHEIDLDGRKDSQLYNSGYGFRLIYNGQVLTDQIEGCPEHADICDLEILKSHLTFPLRDRDCSLLTISTENTKSGAAQVFDLFLSPSGFGVFVVIVLSSMAIGCVLMFLFLSKTQPQLIHRRSYGAAFRENPEMT